jgi:3-hydroxyisobutyrate dehydrogenase-like beta-hydroxyacid dehydrogenase
MTSPITHVALIGLGEVGNIFAAALLKHGLTVSYFDRQDKSALAATLGLQPAKIMSQALDNAKLVIAAVTASHTVTVTQTAAAFIAAQRKATVFKDPLNFKPWRKRADALLSAVNQESTQP